jgi:hypothetical protein
MNLYVLIGMGVAGFVIAGLVVWHSKWLFGLGEDKGEVDQRLRDVEGAIEVEREMNEIMLERPDTSATRKKLQDGTY